MKRTLKLIPFDSKFKKIKMATVLKKVGRHLLIQFHVKDPEKKLVVKIHERHQRKDGLWNDTCFELFIRQPSTGHYLEFHYAPDSKAWNVIHFDQYRNRSVEEYPWAKFHPMKNGHAFKLDLDQIESILGPGPYQIAVTSVITTVDQTHYFALNHCDSNANFHHPASFHETLKV